ncbi:MAG: hypothetical protein UU16_C0037G0016 [Candidatus Woesebacteria bacterium GW2011_GWA2_40_7]|uniref:DUF378 domain-containing protein n=3 Tax=Candidatus Woeseibacteriota TaxID=1752722 RepID=A0A0G0XWE4_9BACT|nr:MAG: hypothetical protein UT17_C0001G0031 [Candidatus Woesebacteria bacterium GW2011_GWB1_39_10]KKR72746.1 MAG: hypothetical protein UU16_C0037G0016 [Candidatus Woesebacteria bacterium GW2011_GWA2_40_7]KKR92217.1 MAG: hypothetical protein UU42_C0002G0031 [Candidatus Woesebacteria bacterium GW2011_GWA1_41_13b]
MKLKTFSKWLVVIGAINWGLVGLFDFNLVTFLLGGWSWLVTLVYILVGLSGFWGAYAMLMGNKK